jgi:hypothetical protein
LILDIFLIALERVAYHAIQESEPKRRLNVHLRVVYGGEVWNPRTVLPYKQVSTNAARFQQHEIERRQ